MERSQVPYAAPGSPGTWKPLLGIPRNYGDFLGFPGIDICTIFKRILVGNCGPRRSLGGPRRS